ncbi:hypothetical protein PA01_12825 [Azoarcus sp. PA01]|nr:hypothetical protein PA01_12825 [Azoarcus sp. PA01]
MTIPANPVSRADELARAVTARLAGITVAGGYLTDIGARVFRGRLRLDHHALPCCVLVEGEDRLLNAGARHEVKLTLPLLVEGHAACDPNNPNDAAHAIIADLKRALFAEPANLAGLAREIRYAGRSIGAREDGLAQVSAVVEIEVDYVENLRAP